MAKQTQDAKTSSPAATTKAIVPSAISLGTDIAERGINASFDLLQGARTELRSIADATFDYADALVKSTLGFTRTVVVRVDQATNASIDQVRSTALDVVGVMRNTGNRATGFFTATTTDVVGDAARPAA